MDSCNKNETKFCVHVPRRSDLCSVPCEVDFIEVQDSSAKSHFHWQIMKCRLILCLLPEVIASPVFGKTDSINIITTNETYKTGKVQKILRNINILFFEARPVTVDMYKNCLSYTLEFHISPEWNKINQYFVQGKEFYNSVQVLNAIKLNITMNDLNGDTQFLLSALGITTSFVKLEDFYLPTSVIGDFLADPEGYIDLKIHGSYWVHILPSMKMGKALSVSKRIPAHCPFKDYDQLRRHWKNMYGYRLPQNNDGIFYFEITFPIPKCTIFTYPNIFITTTPLEVFNSRNSYEIATQFLRDVQRKMSFVLNKKLQITKYDDLPNRDSFSLLDKFLGTPKRLSLPQTSENSNEKETEPRLEFSATCANQLLNNFENSASSSGTSLSRINNYSLENNLTLPSTSATVRNTANSQTLLQWRNKTNKNIKSKLNKGTPQISEYFRVQKPSSSSNKPHTEDTTVASTTLAKKLKNAMDKAEKNSETDLTRNIEFLARNNRLGDLTLSVLSDWLKKHSIPHNSHGKKADLIEKILSHMRRNET